jgi:ribose transport system substrate-binding protein
VLRALGQRHQAVPVPGEEGSVSDRLANGYVANTWRIQMIKTAKAYAAQPEVAAKLKEFKVVSTGEDVAAQIAAINNFIDSGYDAVVVNARTRPRSSL